MNWERVVFLGRLQFTRKSEFGASTYWQSLRPIVIVVETEATSQPILY